MNLFERRTIVPPAAHIQQINANCAPVQISKLLSFYQLPNFRI